MEILIGCDPEIFVKKDGKFRSAHGLIPGDKKNPHKVEGGAVQVDGMALEFNIDPARTEDEFVNNINTVLQQLRNMVEPRGYELAIVPTAKFHKRHFDAQPEEAKELGCEPDFDAHENGAENKKPDNTTTMRTASGHIHLGFTKDEKITDEVHLLRCMTLVKHLDAYLGMPSLLWDTDLKRRQMYGKAGCFRPKSYGVEYRTLSNAWLLSEDLMRYVYQQSVAAINALRNGERFDERYREFRSAINSTFGDWLTKQYCNRYLGQTGPLKHLNLPKGWKRETNAWENKVVKEVA